MRWELVDWRMDVCEQFFSVRLFVLSLDKERSLDIANYKEKFQFQHLISIACVVALTIFLWHAVESSSTMLWWKLKWKLRRWLALLWHSSQTHSSVLCSVLNHFTIEYSWSGMSEISLKFFLGTWDCGDFNAADSREPRLVIIGLVAVYKFQSDKLSFLFLSQKDDEPVFQFF